MKAREFEDPGMVHLRGAVHSRGHHDVLREVRSDRNGLRALDHRSAGAAAHAPRDLPSGLGKKLVIASSRRVGCTKRHRNGGDVVLEIGLRCITRVTSTHDEIPVAVERTLWNEAATDDMLSGAAVRLQVAAAVHAGAIVESISTIRRQPVKVDWRIGCDHEHTRSRAGADVANATAGRHRPSGRPRRPGDSGQRIRLAGGATPRRRRARERTGGAHGRTGR